MLELVALITGTSTTSILALVVFLKNKKSATNILFTLLSFALISWSITSYLSLHVGSNQIFWVRLIMLFVVLENTSFYFLTKTFPNRKFVFTTRAKIEAIYSVLVMAICLTPFLFTEMTINSSGSTSPSPGPAIPLFLIHVLWFVVGAIFSLVRRYRRSTGIERAHVLSLLIGGAILYALLPITNFVLPVAFQFSSLVVFSPLYSTLFAAAIGYSIITQKLFDIRMVVARSVAYTLLIGILAGFYAIAIFTAQTLIFPGMELSTVYIAYQAFLGLIMALTFQPLRRWVTKATDKIFFKNQYNAEELLDALAHTIGETIVLITLIYKTLDLIISQMKVTRGVFVVLSDNGSIFTSQASGYKPAPKLVAKDIDILAKDGILIYDELEENSRYKHILRKYDAAASIPLKTENTTEGVLLLGEKQSGDMFSATDLKVFEIIAPELAVAITNAKAFEKIERFNVTLRQEIKKATAELERKNEQLRELDKAKDEFISMASHQLRTPLTAIKGYLSMLLEGDAGEIKVSQYDFVNEAFSGANRMVGLINDLLNVSRMETGRFFLEPVEVDMTKLVAEEIKQLENHAKEKKLYLKSQITGEIPKLWADETKIRQVVMNFIDNALYYTTNGGVTVNLSADKTHIKFEVHDTGIGVPKAQQKNLFTKFYRADNARHVRPDGTGLGIYLAKRVIDDHSGELIFHSEEGKGSTFGFKIPIKSDLKIKRVSAPIPAENGNPAVGELAAGVGVPAQTIEEAEKQGVEAETEKVKEDLEAATEEKS